MSKKLAVQLALKGCANRPFFHIVIGPKVWHNREEIEQIGTYDPMPNEHNEKLVAINLERLHYWLAQGVKTTKPVAELLGLAGYLPIHPVTYMKAWRKRKAMMESNSKVPEKETDEVKAESN